MIMERPRKPILSMGEDTHTTQAGPQCHCLLASNVAEEGGQRETAISGKLVCVTLVFPAAQGE